MSHEKHIVREAIDLSALLAETEDHTCGALAVFMGEVRNHHEGKHVASMSYDAHVPIAAKVLATLEAEVLANFEVTRCRIVHRIGHLELGEASVAVVVRSAHRAPAFAAAQYAIDTLKVRTPVWKEEFRPDGSTEHLDGTPLVSVATLDSDA
ncbi:MAG: molybdopterin synthase catalytic subunit [Bradymonadia bacterium]|jgi:molybdopterin synthase catalytic subunit